MDIGFFFNFENLVVQLPINPAEIKVIKKVKSKTYEVVKLGDIEILKDRALAEIEFKTFLPQDTWFPAIRTLGEFKTPEFYHDFFETIFKSKKPVRFIVTGINLNMLVSIQNYEFEYKAGEEGDPYISLKLREYRPYSIQTLKVQAEETNDGNWGNVVVTKVSSSTPERPPTEITIGAAVMLNGRVFADSYGGGPGKTFTNLKCKVSLINKKGTHIYHVATLSGSPLGWVLAGTVKLA